MERKQPKCVEIGPGPCLACADAQATIAALQARVSELQGIADEKCRCFLERAEQSEKQLTQRTAELEAANKLIYKKNCELGRAETIINDIQAELEAARKWKIELCNLTPGGSEFADDPAYCAEWVRKVRENQHDTILNKCREAKSLKAELERVKQALCDADERANEYQKALHDFESERALPLSIELERVRGDVNTLNQLLRDKGLGQGEIDGMAADLEELTALRTLIAALPKVEGEINERFCTGSYYSSPHDYRSHVTFETALVALLKHRQGMEG